MVGSAITRTDIWTLLVVVIVAAVGVVAFKIPDRWLVDMEPCVIQCVEGTGLIVNGGPAPVGYFLSAYNPDAFEGYGAARWVADLDEALVFNDQETAYRCWKQQSRIRPFREDGQKNRPLTAYTIEVIPLRLLKENAS